MPDAVRGLVENGVGIVVRAAVRVGMRLLGMGGGRGVVRE